MKALGRRTKRREGWVVGSLWVLVAVAEACSGTVKELPDDGDAGDAGPARNVSSASITVGSGAATTTVGFGTTSSSAGGALGATTTAGGFGNGGDAGQTLEPGAAGDAGAGSQGEAGAGSGTLDYGALCDAGDECVGGACYVPGTGRDSICSARCESNADCPNWAVCSQIGSYDPGHCFVKCESDAECSALNDATDNPLRCMNDPYFGTFSFCVQESEP